MTVVAERMAHVRSAAFQFLVPSGVVRDPAELPGMAVLLADMMTRGAGPRDSRELSERLDSLGLDRGENAGSVNLSFSGSTLARNLSEVFEVYADILMRPHLPADELESAQSLAVQDIQGLEDEPQARCMVELRKRWYPAPLNRDTRGTIEGIQSVTIERLREHYASQFHPTGVIVSVAGDIQFDRLFDELETRFADWKPATRPPLTIDRPAPKSEHLTKAIEQTQLAMAFPSVSMSDPDFFQAIGAVGVLSQDMSARLFTEVREKHGLCYSVYAWHEKFQDRGSIVGFAAARPEKAKETLERTIHEFQRLREGITVDEVDRIRVGLKASMILRQESTSARAGALSSDWFFLQRVRSLEEIQAAVDALTPDSILGYLERHPLGEPTIVTLGPGESVG